MAETITEIVVANWWLRCWTLSWMTRSVSASQVLLEEDGRWRRQNKTELDEDKWYGAYTPLEVT